MNKLTPFVRWVGGKKQSLKIISELIPKQFNKFVEPFVGGGYIFLVNEPKQLIINDINKELMTTYLVIKNHLQALISSLKKHAENHGKDYYQELKKIKVEDLDDIKLASRFLYLNKAGFNGLYRLNRKGIFNVAFGDKVIINVNEKNLLNISDYLNRDDCQIFNIDYQELLYLVEKNDFLFVDPPYDEQYNGYTGLGKFNQEELFNFLKDCDKKGVKWLLTNNNTEKIRELYKDYNCRVEKANSVINCNSKGRKNNREEIFFANYPLINNESNKKNIINKHHEK